MLDFYQVFEGSPRGHGVFWLNREPDPTTGKLKGRASSLNRTATVEDFDRHLRGEEPGIGIVPTTPEGKARWGCIDIDIYKDLDPGKLLKDIEELGLPLVVCRSKSGGIHAFAFASEWIDAGLLQSKLEDWAGCLGHGGVEVWPKQRALSDGTDFGNWVNLPYFGGNNSPRRAMDPAGELLPIESFLQQVEERSFTESWLRKFEPKRREVLPDGPPCLNMMLSGSKIPEGTRNRFLFAVGVYCKKAHDDWESKLLSYNTLHVNPPLPESEMRTLIGSLKKKEYFYTCNQEPLKTYCNRNACRKCKFGIGAAMDGSPVMGTLTKVETDPPIYYLEVRNGAARLRLTAQQLQSQYAFQLACMTQLSVMPAPIKNEEWRDTINELLQNVVVVQVAEEVRECGVFREALTYYCTSTGSDKNPDVISIGKAYYRDGFYYFRNADFIGHLNRSRQKFERNFIADEMRKLGAVSELLKVDDREYMVYKVALNVKPYSLANDEEAVI